MGVFPELYSSRLISQALHPDHPDAGRSSTTRRCRAWCDSRMVAAIVEKDRLSRRLHELLCTETRGTRGPALIPHASNNCLLCRAHQTYPTDVLGTRAWEHRR